MDALDVRILSKVVSDQTGSPINWNFRRSVRSIAREVGADEGTVRNRVRKLLQSGFVSDLRLLVNPRLTGGRDALVWFDLPPRLSKNELVAQLRLLPGVVVIAVFHGSFLFLSFRYGRESSREGQVELMRRLARVERVEAGRVLYPDCKIRLSSSDWAVIKAVQKDPRRTYKSVATEVGLSSRTVKRKLQRMMEGNAVFGFPAFDPNKLKGSIWALLLVTCLAEHREELNHRLLAAFGEYVWSIVPSIPFTAGQPVSSGYNLMLPNVAEGKEILTSAEQMSGVQEARLELFEETYVNFRPLEEDVERYVQASRVRIRGSGRTAQPH